MNSLKLILSNSRYFAPCFVFASLNIITSTWVLHIPYIKEKLHITDGKLGFALFCLALGILTIIPLMPKIIDKVGLSKYTFIGILMFSLAFIGPFLVQNYISLCFSLFLVGIFSGSTDVAMNALVSEIERDDNENFMSSAHGFFSLGGVIGAGLGSLFLIERLSAFYHIVLVSAIVIIVNSFLFKYYRTVNNSKTLIKKDKVSFFKLKALFSLAVIAFLVMASEGAIEHWSKLYLLDVIKIESDKIAGYGFVLFSTTMTIGRFFGDGISNKIGSFSTIIYGIVLSLFGFIAVLLNSFSIALIGFSLIGLGLSVVIPELFRMAGKAKNISATVGISFVSGIGFVGFLLGPVILGLISDNYGLKMSFVFLLVSLILVFVLSLFKKISDVKK